MVRRAGYLQRFYSPHLAEYPAELKDAQGFWGVSNLSIFAPGYNTRMVKPNEVPKTYEDLAQPAMERTDDVVDGTRRRRAALRRQRVPNDGMERRQGLPAKTQGAKYRQEHREQRQVLDLVIAGEYPLVLVIFNHHAYISKTAGAPSEWQPLEPVAATISTIGLPKFAPHPHAALLFLDFVMSKRGQKVFQLVKLSAVTSEMPALQADLKPGGGRFKRVNYMNPEVQFDKGNEWVEYFQKNFVQ